MKAKAIRRTRKCQDTSVVWLSVFGGALALLLFGLAKHARADTLTQSGSTAASSAKKPKVKTEVDCGMACRYHKANDNITFQALYLVNKSRLVDQAVADGMDDDKIRRSLGAFCPASRDTQDCVKTFKSFQAVALLRLRQAMGRNEDSLARLTHGRQDDGTVTGQFTGIGVPDGIDPYTPDLPTLKELQAEFGKMKERPPAQYGQPELKKWAEQLIVQNPKQAFIQFDPKPVQGNPHTNQDGTGFNLAMKKTDRNGNELASADDGRVYTKHFTELTRVARESGSPTDPKSKVLTPAEILGQGKGKGTQDEITYEAFSATRNQILGKVDESMKTEQARRPAAKKNEPGNGARGSSSGPSAGKGGAAKADDPKTLADAKAAARGIDSEKSVNVDRSQPQVRKNYDDDAKITRPAEAKNSRYIRYDLNQLMKDIDGI